MVISFVCLVPVRLLLYSLAVLNHVKGQLQRAYCEQIVLAYSQIQISDHTIISEP